MTYATNRLYCDADSHIMETRDWIAKFTDPEILAKLPEMSLLKSGTKSFEVINEAVVKQRHRAASGAAAVDVVKGQKGWNAPGAFDATERKAALDDLGFNRQLVFSTFSAIAISASRRSGCALRRHPRAQSCDGGVLQPGLAAHRGRPSISG